MPLLKPPEPQLATRRLYLRVDESLAETAERYAEFLGSDKQTRVLVVMTHSAMLANKSSGVGRTVCPPVPDQTIV